jgi:hypothetical protein
LLARLVAVTAPEVLRHRADIARRHAQPDSTRSTGSNVYRVAADLELFPHDVRGRERAVRAGRDISLPVGVIHFFSLADAPSERPDGAEEALRAAVSQQVESTAV